MMKPYRSAVIAVGVLVLGGCGTSDTSHHTSSEQTSLDKAIEFEEIADGQADDPVMALATLGRSDAPDDAFRLYHLTEAEYVRELMKRQHDETAYRRYGDDLLALMRSRKVFINDTMGQLREGAAQGETTEVDAAIVALRRVVSVSSREGEIEIGRLIAVNIDELLDELEQDISLSE